MSMQWNMCANCSYDIFRYHDGDPWDHCLNWKYITYPGMCSNPKPQSEEEDLPLDQSEART